jgi:hypothetical protein
MYTRSAALKGFCMTRSAPAAMAVSMCSLRTFAVTTMIGRCEPADVRFSPNKPWPACSRLRMRDVAARPSRTWIVC